MHIQTLALMMIVNFVITVSPVQSRTPPVHGEFYGDPMYSLLPLDRIPAIRSPSFVTGKMADKQMLAEEPVLGVVINEEAHAYSLWHLDRHEIVNDELSGRAIAVTW